MPKLPKIAEMDLAAMILNLDSLAITAILAVLAVRGRFALLQRFTMAKESHASFS